MQSNSVLCLLISAFLIVDSTFHSHWHVFGDFGVRHQEPAVVNLLGLGTVLVLVLPIEWVCLLRLQKQGGYLVHLSTGLCSKGSRLKIKYNFGTARYQMPSSKLVLNGDCVVQKSEVAKL